MAQASACCRRWRPSKSTGGGKVWFIDVIGDKTPIDKGNLLSSVVWNLVPVYSAMIEDLKANKFGTHAYRLQLADDSVHLLHTKHIPDKIWAEIEAVRKQIIDGTAEGRADLRCRQGSRADDLGGGALEVAGAMAARPGTEQTRMIEDAAQQASQDSRGVASPWRRCAGSPSASRASWRSIACRSSSMPARSTCCWAKTARANPRW